MALEYARRVQDPVLSVVIPSTPASNHHPTVECLHAQTFERPYEVIVVNNGTIDRSEARNCGLSAAASAVVALTDDDTRPPPEWLTVAHDAFQADPDLACLEGPVYGGCRSFGPRHYVGCNLAVRRQAALDVGGFRSAFSEWREDVEFGWRMEAEADGECQFDSAFRMCHPRVPRTSMKPSLERRLKEEYPHRYAEVLNATLGRRLYRSARAAGLTQPIQRARNAVRSLLRDPCSRSRDQLPE